MKLWKLQREGAATECIFQFQSEVNKIKGIFRWRESFYVFFKSFFNCLTSKVAFPNIKMIFDSKSPLSQREPVWQIQLLQNWNWKYFKIFFLEKCCFFCVAMCGRPVLCGKITYRHLVSASLSTEMSFSAIFVFFVPFRTLNFSSLCDIHVF